MVDALVDCHPLDLAVRDAADPSLLDDNERARAARFRFAVHRDRYIAAHAGLRRVLSGHLGIAPESIRLTTTRFGKPILADLGRAAGSASPGTAATHFNLTHSDDVGWVAVAPFPVGIDVECPRPFPELEPLIRSHCTPAEIERLDGLPSGERAAGFLTLWTRKEAVLKAWGTGIGAVPLAALDVGLDSPIIRPPKEWHHQPSLHLTTRCVGLQVVSVAAACADPPEVRLHRPCAETAGAIANV